MTKIFYSTLVFTFLLLGLSSCNINQNHKAKTAVAIEKEEDENEGYDGAAARDKFEFEQIKDPKLGYVPSEKMIKAVDYTESSKSNRANLKIQSLNWVERGPIYDSTGPSNGNTRGASANSPGTYTAGRTAAILVDTLSDPTGNTVFCGGIAGGLWKCTNFLSTIPNWQHINDRFDNMAISYICQDPSNRSIMYFSTGEATSNADAVYGGGVYRSTDGGTNWTRLPGTLNNIRNFKILCDAAGNVYLASRLTTIPVINTSGLLRSKDHGDTWENITPTTLSSSNANCTDIEISSTGRLHASFGYLGATGKVQHVYTTTPSTVTSAAGWNASTGIRVNTTVAADRLELAVLADTLYAVTIDATDNLDSVYKSIDGGATFTKQNTTTLNSGILSGQGWYNITLAINPANSSQFIVGGLDAYRSTNSGVTIPTRMTYWVGNGTPYVHADHHFMQWWMTGTESRIVIGCDGGVFYSNNAATTFTDKNRNLAIKQFYAGAIHPSQGSPYLLAGAQDNGVHQLSNPGLSYSKEVTGGDGCFVHINQQNPLIQFGSYVYNSYRRSVNGGATWSSVTLSSGTGLFVNPFDYDDGQNIMYATYGTNQIIRWRNAATTSTDTTILTLSGLIKNGSNSNATAYKVSPYTKDRVFIGGSTGKILRLDNASTVTRANVNANVTDISGATLSSGYVSCVNTGSSDNFLVATFSSYGVKHVWYSTNAGTSWTNIDGTIGSGGLPDMPVRWAVFDPQNNNKLIIATEAGVYTTDAINGANTVWNPDVNFPTVRTDMLQIRLSDNTIVAATHGRGLFTAVLPSTPEVRFSAPFATLAEATTSTTGCRSYRDYNIDVSVISAPAGDATVTYSLQGGNTAIEGTDFDFTANGDFNSPSKQQTFVNGVATSKSLTIRVYDDAEVEDPENFTITFNISGTTNAISGSANTYSVTISDNDFTPALPTPTVQSATLGTPQYYLSYTTGSAPLDQRLSSKRSQWLYTAAELTGKGLRAGTISNMQLAIFRSVAKRGYSNFTVKMGQTTRTTLYDANQIYPATTTIVKNPFTFSPAVGSSYINNTINFDAPFTWDGTSSIAVEVCYNNTTADSSATFDQTVGYADGSTSTQATLIWQDNIDCSGTFDVNSPNFDEYTGGLKPIIVFGGSYISTGTPVATALNATRTVNFMTGSPNNDLFYYLTTGETLASFKNTSSFNYGCTQVILDRAGTGTTKFWSDTDSATFLMNKTYRVLPTTNNSAGIYDATFYFTKAEKEGWEAATKQSFDNIKIIKLPSQVSSVTPANQQPDGPGTVQIITPTSVGTLGNNYYITGHFTNGFSGFGFGIPVNTTLPITLLNFSGKLQGDNALLEWSTSSEQNSNLFEIEKSLDGISYHKIGELKAAGTSNDKRNYSLLDREFALDLNYYKLNMVDKDNKSKTSNVVILKNTKNHQGVVVVNNPFSSYIKLRFGKVPQGKVKLQLTDLSGRLIHTQTYEGLANNILDFNVGSTAVSKGVYILAADVDGTRYSMKVMKQ